MRLMTTLVLLAGLLGAQEKTAPPKPDTSHYETAIIPVKTLTGDSFRRMSMMLNVFGAKYQADEVLRTVVVYAPKEVIAEMRKVIEALDRPGSEAAIGRNIEMTLSFLRCNAKAGDESKPLPPDLESVAKQLRAATMCKDVNLWDVIPLRLQEGKSTEQSLRLPPGRPDMRPLTAFLRVIPQTVSRRDNARYVRFDQIRIQLQIPTGTQNMETSLMTSGDFKEGQKSVIGKTSGEEADSSVFVVVELKVLD